MDIDKLEAGPEMDILIDERVMGRFVDGAGYGGAKKYTTDIAAAWDVVELWQKRGTVDVSFFGGTLPDRVWKARIRPDIFRDGNPGVEGRGDSAPLAICRAALKAVGA